MRHCASKISHRRSATGTAIGTDQIRIQAFGTAQDYIRWAVALEKLASSTLGESRSARSAGITESVRFIQLWTATNALYSRNQILQLVTNPHKDWGERKRFEELYAAARLVKSFEREVVDALTESLDIECNAIGIRRKIKKLKPPRNAPGRVQRPYNPSYKRNPAIGTHPLYKPRKEMSAVEYPTMWEVIDQKYSRPEDRQRPYSIGKTISEALAKGDWPRPTGPQLIYGARNWTVHGMLLTSFFRGSSAKYPAFIENIQLLLAAVLDRFARRVLPLV